MGEHTPGDPSQLVGECDRQDVAMQPAFGCIEPAFEPITLPALGLDQHHPCSLYEQNAQIAVTSLRYLSEDGAVAGGDLFWHQAKPGGEVAPFGENLASPDRGYHCA